MGYFSYMVTREVCDGISQIYGYKGVCDEMSDWLIGSTKCYKSITILYIFQVKISLIYRTN